MKKLIVTCFITALSINLALAQSNDPASVKLQKMVGKWDVTMTMVLTPRAKPTVVKNLVADRTMIGDYCLNETMTPGPKSQTPPFQRMASLAWNKNEMRWDYISIDTRITAGIMYFIYKDGDDKTINSFITSFPHPGFGPSMQGRGQAVYVRNVIEKISNTHDTVKQYWRLTDKPEWLAVQYDYVKYP